MEIAKDKYAVIHFETVYHEGDERSRTHPGHGYPAYSEDIQKITTFKTEEDLKTWITKNTNKKFTAIRYEELSVKTTLEVKIG